MNRLHQLRANQKALEILILKTPTGPLRDQLTELNIQICIMIDKIEAVENPIKSISVCVIKQALEGMDMEDVKNVVVVYATYSIYAQNELSHNRIPKNYVNWMSKINTEDSDIGRFVRSN